MKNTKKTILAIGAVALLLGILLMPCINATMLEGETVKATTEKQVDNSLDLTEENKNINSEPVCFGSIYGYTGGHHGWQCYPLPRTRVVVRTGGEVVGMDISSIFFCYYKIQNLPINQTYTVTASYRGFYSETKVVKLTLNKPNVEVGFSLERKPDDDNVNIHGNSNTYSCHILEQILSISQHFNQQQNNNI